MFNRIPFDQIRTIFFDYDGTIHNSIEIYGPAFRKSYAYLVESGLAEERDWSDKEISYWLGFSPPQMWANFMPDLDEEVRKKCSAIVGEEMKSLTEKGYAKLFEGALETLKYLQGRGYNLVFISNCRTAYKDYHKELFSLGDYFEELVCSEEYDFIPKYEVLKDIKNNYKEEMV
ncbi:MAG TPA: HAD hydrolase-like protein, partial [Bacteroidales bacterium]|nr:HAD hydrolase-like protein [Bacteroidales bacterium]